jgi:hypothetical protein
VVAVEEVLKGWTEAAACEAKAREEKPLLREAMWTELKEGREALGTLELK